MLTLPSGGTITTSGNFRIHTFNSSSNFVVPSGVTIANAEYLVIGDGGSGGDYGGGGGVGGISSVVGENSGGGASVISRITMALATYVLRLVPVVLAIKPPGMARWKQWCCLFCHWWFC